MVSVLFQRLLVAIATTYSLGIALAISFGINQSVTAQVISDETLPTTVLSSDNLNFTIEGGLTAGNNLFHSFENFSIPLNGAASFNNANDIDVIFSRVTGNARSILNGRLSANGSADLLLLNPNGIVFGPDAQLNLGGSFIGTTAESIIFEGSAEFSAVQPSAQALLEIRGPIGLRMGPNSRRIVIRGEGHSITGGGFFPSTFNDTPNGLQVAGGQNLLLIGSTLDSTGGIIRLSEGNIYLSSVQDGFVQLDIDNRNHASKLTPSEQAILADINLADQSLISISGIVPGQITLQARNIQLDDASQIISQSVGASPSGDVTILATESIRLSDAIRTAPDVEIAQGTIRGSVASAIVTEGLMSGRGGDIFVDARNLSVEDGAHISAYSFDDGAGGNVSVNLAQNAKVSGFSLLDFTLISEISTLSLNRGDAGHLNITAQNMSLTGGAGFTSFNFGSGRGGNIQIDVRDKLTLDGFIPEFASPTNLGSAAFSTGNSGNVTVNTPTLSILNGSSFGTTTLNQGTAGDVTVNATDSITVSGAIPELSLFSRIQSDAPIFDPVLRQLFSLPDQPLGASGDVMLNTQNLRVEDGGSISASNQGFGNSGELQINAHQILLENEGNITALSESGQGGEIQLNVEELLFLDTGSKITAEATGSLTTPNSRSGVRTVPINFSSVDGGNITIESLFIVGLGNSDIVANSFQGNGGDIAITTQGLFGLEFRDRETPDNDITASSEFGIDGTVEITTPEVDPNSRILQLSETLVDSSQLIQPGCSAENNQFVLTGRGGLPAIPVESMSGDRPWFDLRNPLTQSYGETTHTHAGEQLRSFSPIREATGMAIASDGTLQLVASGAQNVAIPHASCTS
ncbi:MAG: S-layer family protein [Cyanobacteria bacterium P01_F01_bin.150]